MMHRSTLSALALLAAGASAAGSEPIEEISVVATRRSVDVANVSTAVSTADEAVVLEVPLTTDALQQLVGVALQETTPGQGAAIVRGLKGSSILHLVDGMRLSNALFRSAPTPWFALVPAASIERIEAVRGTPTSLYGSDAVGGIVQSVSHLPDFAGDTFGVERNVIVRLDSAQQLRSIRATLDAGTAALAASLSAEFLDTGNRRTGGDTRVGPSGYSAKGFRAAIRGKPADSRTWFLDLHFMEQPETPRVDELVPGFGQVEPSSAEFAFAPNRRTFVHLQHDVVTAAGLDWKVDAAWQRIDDDRRNRDTGATVRQLEQNRSDLYGLTTNVSGHRGTMSWIAGIDLYHDEVHSARQEQALASGAITDIAPRFPDSSSITQAGVFANATWRPGSRLGFSGGIRYNDVQIDLPDGTRISPGRFSGDVGWVLDLGAGWQVVANFGYGFRAPNIADLGTLGARPGNRFNIPNPALGVETATQADLGLRYRDERTMLELVAWSLRYRDRIVSVSTGDTTMDGRSIVQSANAASATLHGLEAGLKTGLSDRVSLRATLNYARGEQRIAAAPEPADRVPPLHGRIVVDVAISGRWATEGWILAAGRQDRLSVRDVDDVRIDPNGTPGWVSIGASARWTSPYGWDVVGGVDNVLDEKYRMHGSGIDAPGRNIFVSVRRCW